MAAEGLAVKGWQGPGWLDGRRDEAGGSYDTCRRCRGLQGRLRWLSAAVVPVG